MREFAVSPKGNPFMTAIELQTAAPPRAIEPAPGVPVAGLVDLDPRTDGHALVRVNGYRPSPADVYLSAGQIKQYGLRKGDRIDGTARPSAGGRAKYRPLVSVDAVNGLAPELARARPHFDDLTPLYPQERLRLEDGNPSDTARIIDLVAPIGKGQRGLIVAAPKAGKTMILQAIAASMASSHTLAGGVAASALLPPRQFLGAARNIEDGGSLTILSTALVDTGSRMDDVLFEEFKGTGNMELRLRRDRKS